MKRLLFIILFFGVCPVKMQAHPEKQDNEQ